MSVADFAVGERVPKEVVAPADAAELAATLRRCDRDGQAAVIFGGRTLQGVGHVPQRFDVAVHTGRLRDIAAYDHRDLTISVDAGCSLTALDTALRAHGQFIPLDAPRPALATVGGTLAAGWLGPRRGAYGRARDFVIGTTVALADGTIARAGGMVVKNSTGYDLSKLYLGSLGTLGAIVRANFKTLPLPRARRVALAPLPEGTRVRARALVATLDCEPAAAVMIRGFAKEIDGNDGGDGRILILYEGSQASVERATRELRSALGSGGIPETRLIDAAAGSVFARLLDAYIAPVGPRSATYRSLGLASETASRFDAFERVARTAKLTCDSIEDLCNGDVIARLSVRVNAVFLDRIVTFDALRRTALAGARTLAAAPAALERLDAWGEPPEALDAVRALKARFDPNGTLAPGRFGGRV